MKLSVYNQSGEKTSEQVELDDRMFAVPKIKPELVHQVATSLLASRRRAIAHTKTRGEVRGGGKKPWPQKGTGRARAGSIRSPLWRGGGITFGPRSARNWTRKINKQEKALALRAVLSDKVASGQLLILENLMLDAPKTRQFASQIKNLQGKFPGLSGRLTIIISASQKDLLRAGKNLPYVTLMPASSLNILTLSSTSGPIVMRDALSTIEQTYTK